MSELYDVLNEEQPKKEKAPRLSKEEYAEKMKEWRTTLFSMANEQTLKAVGSPESYKTYLDLQARLDYQVTNVLLVMAQNPDVKLLKDDIGWRKNNKYIRPTEKDKGIQILEPGRDYIRRDGTIGVNYNPKNVYDISQLNGKSIIVPDPKYSDKEIIAALMHGTLIKPEIVTVESDIPSPVYYADDVKKIYVKAGLEPNEMITGLVREYCTAECAKMGIDREDSAFMVASASYVICQKYGMKGCDESFMQHTGEYFEGLDQREVKGELEDIKGLYKSVSDRMERGIYTKQQEHTEKQNEHSEFSR
ncbi:hypothetical protein [[Eubacterium] hominis]|uniref:hypothetical protein n=1 Tax=[Eubacterium] hominis TaxID=2764325 RepID=UPI003A4DBACE